METRHELELARWTKILDKNISGPNYPTAKIRLGAYLGSLTIGREFGETPEVYLERKELTQFVEWARLAIA